MSIAAFAVAEAPMSASGAAPKMSTKRTPGKRQTAAVADTALVPEAR